MRGHRGSLALGCYLKPAIRAELEHHDPAELVIVEIFSKWVRTQRHTRVVARGRSRSAMNEQTNLT